jgi:hypothetical protein
MDTNELARPDDIGTGGNEILYKKMVNNCS